MPEKYRLLKSPKSPECWLFRWRRTVQSHPSFSVEIGNDFPTAVMPTALRGPQASQVKFTESRTQWMMKAFSNALLSSSKELTCPEVTILFGNRAFVKFVGGKNQCWDVKSIFLCADTTLMFMEERKHFSFIIKGCKKSLVIKRMRSRNHVKRCEDECCIGLTAIWNVSGRVSSRLTW